MVNIGFIGLGQMGNGIASNILKQGYPLLVYDVRKEPVNELVEKGAKASSDDLLEIVENCHYICLCLPNASIVEKVMGSEKEFGCKFKKGQTIIDFGTTNPIFTQKMSNDLLDKGINFIDAPVSGMEAKAIEGTLTIMVGGDQDKYQEILPLLNAIGSHISYLGPSGSGQLAKMLNNVLFNISCAATAEILPMAVKLELDPEEICSVIQNSTGQSYGFDFFSKLILERNFKPGYPMVNAYKDMANIIELSDKYHIPLPVTNAAMITYKMELCHSGGIENKGSMVRVWERLLGVEVHKKTESL